SGNRHYESPATAPRMRWAPLPRSAATWGGAGDGGAHNAKTSRVMKAPPPPTPPHNAKTRWGRGAHRASGQCHGTNVTIRKHSRRCAAEAREVRLLLVVARRQLEQARRGAAQDVVLALFRHERQVPDAARQIEVPVRIVGGVEQMAFGVD